MKPKSAKQKGKLLENFVADKLQKYGIDNRAIRDGASGAGNREKADVNTSASFEGRNIGIECKNYANLHIPEWWRQTEKLETIGRLPVLVYKLPKRPLHDTLVSLRLDDFLAMLKKTQEPKLENPDREFSWKLKNLYTAVKAVLKEIEK